jgi:serine/threonine protein phosphatase 1
MNQYAISDIHGCYYTFKEMLSKIAFTKGDTLYLLGDYINRGSNSKPLIDFIIQLQKQGYNIIALKGNHEAMVFDSIELENWTPGAPETLKSFGITHLKNLDESYIKWFSKLKHYHESESFLFVHAGLNFEIENPFEDLDSMIWIKDWHKNINYSLLQNRKIIHGHVPVTRKTIEQMLDKINTYKILNIDNGCYMKETKDFGSLCCIELTSLKLIFQKNID